MEEEFIRFALSADTIMHGVPIRNHLLFSLDSHPYGLPYPEWTSKWWQWILSIPNNTNPARDTTGVNCSISQEGPVWFLAGTLGGRASRVCTIPYGKAILLPVLNHGGTLADEPRVKSEEELHSYVSREMDLISDLEIRVDGIKVNELGCYRVQSPTFEVVLPHDNLFGGQAGPTKGTGNGYWLFLRPLPLGKHSIDSSGSCSSGDITIGVEYNITIK